MYASTCFRRSAIVVTAVALYAAHTAEAWGQEPTPSERPEEEQAIPQAGPAGGDGGASPHGGAFEAPYEWFQTLIPPRMASDMFGRRIARNYIAIQVTVENSHEELNLIVYDVEVDYSWLLQELCMQNGQDKVDTSQGRFVRFLCESSSQELSILRGVAEKGQINDPRNNILRILSGLGAIASTLPGVIVFSGASSFPAAVAAFNGAGLTAYRQTFPDFTVNQLHRLNDSAYTANTVVKTKNSRAFVAFIPMDLFLSKNERKQYWSEPHVFFGEGAPAAPDLRKLQIIISAEHVVPRRQVQPLITAVQIDQEQMSNFATKDPVSGSIAGRFLGGARPVVADAETMGWTIEIDPTRPSTDRQLFFVITPSRIPSRGRSVSFEAIRGDLRSNVHRYALKHGSVPPASTPISSNASQATQRHSTIASSAR